MVEKNETIDANSRRSAVITISALTPLEAIEKAVSSLTEAGASAVLSLRGPAEMVVSAINRLKAHHVSAAIAIRGDVPPGEHSN